MAVRAPGALLTVSVLSSSSSRWSGSSCSYPGFGFPNAGRSLRCSSRQRSFNSFACETSHLQRQYRVKSSKNVENEGPLFDQETLQRRLNDAVKEENYALAAKLRDELHRLHVDAKSAVLAANSRFYNAFLNGDLTAMRAVWAKGDQVSCVHPGAETITGYDLVMDSWDVVCGVDQVFPIEIQLKDVQVHVNGDIGYVTCLEVVKTKGSSWGKQVATNIFERIAGKWYICVHHASHVDLFTLACGRCSSTSVGNL